MAYNEFAYSYDELNGAADYDALFYGKASWSKTAFMMASSWIWGAVPAN